MRAAAFALASWLLGAAPAAPQEPTLLPPVNATCPVLEGEPVDPEMTLLYRGVPVGLCCEDCQRKFRREPERYVHRLPELEAALASADPAAAAAPAAGEEGGLAAFFGPFHPMTVHFPIALLLAAALGEILVLLGWSGAAAGAAFAHRLGTLGALAAAPLGLALAETTALAPSLHDTVEWHERLGFTATALAAASLLVAEWARRGGPAWTRTAYRVFLVAAVIAVAVAGHLGARLVFGADFLPL